MAVRSLSLRDLTVHYLGDGPRSAVRVRQILGRPSGPVRLGFRNAPISVLTHNMALLVSPAPYLGAHDGGPLGEARARAGVISEICARIRVLSPDIVGLCEVFADDERRAIRNVLEDLYPFFREGPDEDDLESDGGLLVLSRFPLLDVNDIIFRDCDGWDCLANKGVLHIRVRGPAWPSALDIFYSHTQNPSTGAWVRGLYPDDYSGPRLSTGEVALYKQLESMRGFVESRADVELPALIMGDLNIPAANSAHYQKLLNTLDGFRDTWSLAGHSVTSGPTYTMDNNFYEDNDDRPSSDSRLDYILLRPGRRACPMIADVEVLKFTRNLRYISDHFGVQAVFDPIAVVDP